MQRVLRKRMLRDLRANIFRYLALGLIIVFSVYLVVSILGAATTVIDGVAAFQNKNCVEDGEFTTFVRLTDEEQEQIRSAGVTLEEESYLDLEAGDGSTVRVFRDRERINLVYTDRGHAPERPGEIVLEKRYARVHGLDVGDRISLDGRDYTVCGIGSSPDYDSPTAGMTDPIIDSSAFGTGFVAAKEFAALEKSGGGQTTETFVYAYRLDGQSGSAAAKITGSKAENTDTEGAEDRAGKKENTDAAGAGDAESKEMIIDSARLRDMVESFPFDPDTVEDPFFQKYLDQVRGDYELMLNFTESPLFQEDREAVDRLKDMVDPDIHNLQQFVERERNLRIGPSAERMKVNLFGGGFSGVIILVLLAYIMAVYTVHEIDRDSEVIGTLYATGVRPAELRLHFSLMPALVTGAAGMVGTIAGYSPIGVLYQMQDTYNYYSVPDMPPALSLPVLVYGVIIPPVLAFATNIFVISRRLQKPALALIRGEKKKSAGVNLPLERISYIRRFRIRELVREGRAVLTVLIGLYICLFLFFCGADIYAYCRHIDVDTRSDTRFEYMYTCKYPMKKVPEGGEAAYGVPLKKEIFGYDMDVTLLGIGNSNPYFDVRPSKGTKSVTISSAMAQKFGLKKGDLFTLEDVERGRYYAFTVDGITQYSPAFFVFMDIDSMREMMGQADDYYNVVFADHALDIEAGRLLSTLRRQSVVDASGIFMEQDASMIYVMIGTSAAILVLVIYLMLGVMIDHASYDISLMKIFGYRDGEIRGMYLNGSLVCIALGTALVIPLAKLSMDLCYPFLVANVASSVDVSMPWYVLPAVYAAVMVVSLLIVRALTGRIRRITPAQVLKNRE